MKSWKTTLTMRRCLLTGIPFILHSSNSNSNVGMSEEEFIKLMKAMFCAVAAFGSGDLKTWMKQACEAVASSDLGETEF